MYTVDFTSQARKQLFRLSKDDQVRVANAIEALAANPRPHGCKKLVGKDEWRIKSRDIRIIYEIHDRVLRVVVIRVSHRSNAYR